ncbi:MAG: chromosome segregation protein SMC [Planctomycetaceae bacterium]
MLKSLELAGFKSFADRTRFEFSEGITGVVGPNGSGKSNVVDGIKWILGDQSAKSLRGKEMTDVIFNGALNRQKANLAEATITFDNSNGFLPLETQEVQVGRRLWRSGDSEYLINQETARLKDVRQLFMGTGAGSAAYSIIEQGRVDQILQANPTSRRAIFEEAAGISLYKTRRIEFVRRMERVDQMLLRLTDIVDEVEVQRDSLRTQAEKAAKYRDISEKLRTLWLGLAADDSRHLQGEITRIQQQIAQYAEEIEKRADERRALEEQLAKFDQKISGLEEQIQGIQRQRASIRENIAGHLATLELQTNRTQELESDVQRLRKQRSHMAARLREGILELEHNRNILAESEDILEDLLQQQSAQNRQIQEQNEELKQTQTDLEAARKQQSQLQQKIEDARVELLELQSQRQAAEASRQAAEKRLHHIESKLHLQREELESARILLEKSQKKLAEAERALNEARQNREILLNEQSQFRDLLATLREERSAAHARLAVLQDYESRQEGLGIGAREILRRAKTSQYSPWNQIQGTVADLIEVELENAALLEAALNQRAEFIVIHEFDSLVRYLLEKSSVISGRVGFVEFPGSSEGEPSTDPDDNQNPQAIDLSGCTGVVQRADALVKSTEEHHSLARRLLRDTWIVETLDIAFQLAREAGRGCRFVTLQGELLEADGTLIVGTARSETTLVSRKSELRKLKNDVLKLERKIEDEEKRLAGMDDNLSSLDENIAVLQAEFDRIATNHQQQKNITTNSEQELNRLTDEQQTLTEEIEQRSETEENFSREFMTREMQQIQMVEEVQSLETTCESLEREIARHEHHIHRLREKRSAQELELATHQERLKGIRESCERLERDHTLRIQQRNEAERRLSNVLEKREQLQLNLLQTRSFVAELYIEDEQHELEVEDLRAEQDQLRGSRAELRRSEIALREADRLSKEHQHEHEILLRDANHRLTTLSERIEEEYQMSLEQVVNSGVSAFRDYLHQLEHSEEHAGRTDDVSENPSAESNGDDVQDVFSENGDEDAGQNTSSKIRFEDVRNELEAQVNRLRRKRKMMGNVNTDSLQNLDELETRYIHLSTTLQDLLEAKKHLEELVRKIDVRCKELFTSTFDAVRANFQELFRKAFGGGDGDIVLEDPDDVLECGIDIVARPPGKELKSITLMSGGEKTLTAFALLLALFKYRPSPYCVLDEVDAALDEANVERLLALLEEFKQSTQFVIITHKKPTMSIADRLYGVTMEQSGISKRMTVQFENIGENGEFQSEAGGMNAAA